MFQTLAAYNHKVSAFSLLHLHPSSAPMCRLANAKGEIQKMADMPSFENPVSVATLIASYCKEIDDHFDFLIEKKGNIASAPFYTLFSVCHAPWA